MIMNNLPNGCDYLVVGSGAAGSIVAARLSEDPQNNVLILEAGGGNRSPLLRIPGLGFAVANHPKFNWGFSTEPSSELNDRSLVWLQGRVLGGSSSINGMIYTRGHSREYDIWQQMGCNGWGSEDVLPYFKKLESKQREEGRRYEGEGPIQVRKAKPNIEICDAFLRAAQDEGYSLIDDMNSDPSEGFGFYDINAGNGLRMSSATAYLEPVMNRENLTVITNTQVLRILIKGDRAYGVEVLHKGIEKKITVEKEVIISSGAIKTPQLLMLSGIGPEDELRNLGIQVKIESPNVGKTLQNHACYRPQYICSEPVSASRHLKPWNAIKAGIQYSIWRTGPLAESYAVAGGFFKTSAELEISDAQVVLLSALGPTKTGGADFRIRDLLPKEHGFGLTIYQGSPSSRGSVSLRSSNPLDPPVIHSGYFSDREDIEVLKKAVKRMQKLMQQPAIRRYIKREVIPGKNIESDDLLEAEIRQNGATAYHQCASCAMGANDDSVVDTKLRVRGILGLRVADASVMPRIPNAALHAPTLMIGEKAAAMIKGKDK
ncbi:MAG: glucose-methanol-choline oxidoreductase [Rhodospirillaceae bacterium]|nr:glucose-methanol-choline oxidoreductase [Rhodospirillaceae bacterium]